MSKIPNLKQKRSVKAGSKPLHIALSFPKKNNEDSPEKRDHVSEALIKIPVGNKFVPPKHSSTPKPKQNHVKPVSPSDVLGKHLSKFQMKDCVVLVERLKKEDMPIKASVEKAIVNSVQKKHQQNKLPKIPTPDSVSMAHSSSILNSRKEQPTKDCENTFVTTIPSEALKSFGLLSSQLELRSTRFIGSSPLSDTSLLIETPPRTSTACSSVGDHSTSHTESCDGVTVNDANDEFPTTVSRSIISASILFQTNNVENVDQLNASSSNQPDPLEMGPQDKSLKINYLPVDVHCDYLYGLNQRMNYRPDIINLHELDFNNPDIRLVAPYALRLDLSQDEFFLYTAAVDMRNDKFCCVVFGVLENYLIAYSGHFIVEKEHLYDPTKKAPVDEVKLTDFSLCRQHLNLFNEPNKMLVEMKGYFLQASHPSHCKTQLTSFELLMSTINQVQLKEKVRAGIAIEQLKAQIRAFPAFKDIDFNQSCVQAISPGSHKVVSDISKPRTEHVFFETCLPIGKDSIERILKRVKAANSVKSHFNNLGSLQLKCATEAEFFTIYYAAYEEPGCTAFYRNVFLLGYVDSRYIVGVISDKNFFIMATRRLYNRNSLPSPGMQPIKFCPEMIEMIDLPLWLPHEYALTMLEARQVLRHSREYACDYRRIVESLGVLDFEYPPLSFFNDSELRSRKMHNAWLEKMLNVYFSPDFCNSLNEFPVHPSSSKNPFLFSESVIKLWIHQLIRKTHELKDSSLEGYINNDDMSETDFFTLNIETFIANFLSLFGLSSDSKFLCQLLGPDGTPFAVCSESLTAQDIGAHVYVHHTLPLTWNDNSHKSFSFCPFSLIHLPQNPPLSDHCDLERLSWARYLVDRRSGGSYLELLQTLKNVEAQLDDQVSGKVRQKKRVVESQKRRLASEECISSCPKRGRLSSDPDLIISD